MLIIQAIMVYVNGWPLVAFVGGVALLCTILLRGIQFRYFITMFEQLRIRQDGASSKQSSSADMTPFQALMNTLNVGLGNGSIAGMAVAIYSGGPGATLWIAVTGILLMAVRFAEVFLGSFYTKNKGSNETIGGPMLYLKEVGGTFMATAYAFFILLFGWSVCNAMQTNSIALSLQATWGIAPLTTACVMALFVAYVVAGGAQRMVLISSKIVPLKVIIFFASSCIILGYHWQALIPALQLIVESAFTPLAPLGALGGISVAHALSSGVKYTIIATESGLGTAAVFFSSTGSTTPVKDGINAMLTTFVSTVVCCITALLLIVTGVWNSGLTSTALTVAAFNTVFGVYGGWIVSFLAITFGTGLLVSYAYVTHKAWLYLTGNWWPMGNAIIFCIIAFVGAIGHTESIWSFLHLINAFILLLNLCGILYLLPTIVKELARFEKFPF